MQLKFKAYVAGFGSGKTWVGCGGICKGMWERPKINQGYFAPTYPQIRDISYTCKPVEFFMSVECVKWLSRCFLPWR